MVSEGQLAWLVGALYKPGQVTLRLVSADGQETFEWVDRDFEPYYLAKDHQGEPIKKVNLFTGNELELIGTNRLVVR